MSLGSGTESALATDVAFWVVAVSTIISAVAVVQMRDMFRAGLFLAVAFLGVAGMYVLLRAEFLAVVQVMIYVGAISVLVLFAILMTRNVEEGNPSNRIRAPVGLLAVLLFAAMAYVAVSTDWNLIDEAAATAEAGAVAGTSGEVKLAAETVAKVGEVYSNTIPGLAGLLLRDFVLAFEVASLLLLAALVGALTLVRER